MRSNFRAFWKCLRQHPGVPVLSLMCLAGFVAGWSNGSLARGLVGAAVFSVIFGPIVIATAWTGRKPYMQDTQPKRGQEGGEEEGE